MIGAFQSSRVVEATRCRSTTFQVLGSGVCVTVWRLTSGRPGTSSDTRTLRSRAPLLSCLGKRAFTEGPLYVFLCSRLKGGASKSSVRFGRLSWSLYCCRWWLASSKTANWYRMLKRSCLHKSSDQIQQNLNTECICVPPESPNHGHLKKSFQQFGLKT
jgi:hypothetical protein